MKTFLYTSQTFKDITSTATPYAGTWVGYTIFHFSVKDKTNWTRFVTALTYSGANDLVGTSGGATLHSNYTYNTDNDTTTIQRPSKLLTSFSTNAASKVGNDNEKLDIDILRMIYDKGLSSLKINDTANNTLKNAYNNAEFATHSGMTGAGTNSGHTHSNYTKAFCYSTDADFPQVSATAKSKHILYCRVTQATVNNHYAIIEVKHNDNSIFTDTIFFVNAMPRPTVTLSSNNESVCPGTAINEITVTATNGTAAVTNLPAGLTFNASTGKITGTPTASGTYKVTVSNSACSVEETGTITVKPLPTVTLTPTATSVCTPDTIKLTANGTATSYSWSGVSGSGGSATVSAVGTYNVTVTGYLDGCTSTASTTVTVKQSPTVAITGDNTACTRGELTASGAATYLWSNDSTTATIHPTTTGTYTYTVTGTATNGCTASASQQITVKPTPVVTISGKPVLCSGSTDTLIAQSTLTGTTFVWSDDDHTSGSTLPVSTAGTYTVTGTLDGCSGTATQVVTEATTPAPPTTTSNSICGTGSVALSASGTGGTCYWYANNTTHDTLKTGNSYSPTLNTIVTMTYYVSVRSDEGCESSRQPVTATAYALPATPTVSNITHCGAGDFTLSATVSDGSTLQWFSDNEAENAVTNLNVHVDNTTTYYVRSANEHCNSSLEQLTITINPIPAKPTAISATSICDHGTSVLTATPAAGCELNWFETSNVTGTPLPGNETYTTPQLYASRKYYVVSKNTTTGCMSEVDSVTVNVYPKPGLPTVPNASLCAMGDITLTGTTGTNGTTLRWYNADNELKATADSYTTQITATSTTFKVASYNATTGCEGDKVEITVTVSPSIPAPTAAATVYACGGSAELTASSSATLKWYSASGDSLSMGATYAVNNITVPTVYKVAAVVGNCESDMVSMTVEPAVVPAAPTSDGNSRCGAGLITLTATVGDGLECRWYDSETSTEVRSENTTYTPNISGTTTYYVEAINASTQCVSATRTPVQAVMNTLPFTPTVSNVAYCGAGTYTLTAGANGNTQGGFHWYSDAEGTQEIQSSVEMTTSNTYYVAWIDDQPCRSALASLAVTINPIPEMPTATAPEPYCSNSNVQVSMTATPGTNGDICRWYNANQTYTNIQQNSYGQSLSASANFYVTTYNTTTGCESDLKLMAVVINSVPSTPVVSGQSRCGAGTVTFTGEVSAPNTFRWYSADNTPLTEGGSYTTDALEANANYLVSTVNTETGCESQKVTVTATVHPAVVAPEVTTPQTLCGAGTTTLTATTAQGNSLRWYADAQGETELTANANGSYTTPDLTEDQSYTYYVGAYNTNCSGPLAAITVNVYANPTIENVTDGNRCGAGDVTIEATASTDAQVRWYETATGGEFIPEGSSTLTLTNLQAPSTNVRYAEAYNSTTGCNSSTRVPVTAYVYETYTLNDPKVACDSFVWNGQPYYSSGNYTQTLQTIHNCDSVVTLQLTINNTKRTTVDSIVCNTIAWNGHTYTQSGTYVDTLQAACNCDSIVTLNLTVKRSSVATDSLTLCSAQLPYDYNGTQISGQGTYTVTIPNAVGCDSTITLTVTVNQTPGLPSVSKRTRCGEGNVTLQAGVGTNGTTCYWYDSQNATDTVHSGNTYTLSLSETTIFYVASVNAVTGCASARVADTAIIYSVPAAPVVKDTARCGDGPVTLEVTVADPTWNVQWFANATTSTVMHTGLQYSTNLVVSENPYQYYVRSADEHCQSSKVMVKATVNAIPPVPTVTAVTNCGPNTFSLTPNNTNSCRWYATATATTYTEITPFETGQISEDTSFYVSNINTQTGCESGKTEFPVTVYPVYDPVDLYDDVCQGTTYTDYGLNVSYAEAGVKDITLATVSSHGCDSVVTLHLNVLPLKYHTFPATACNQYTWNDSIYTTSGVYQQTFTAINGCDSVVTLNLTINNSKTFAFSDENCDSYTWNDSTYTNSGVYQQTFTAANGCDSVVTLTLTLHKSVTNTITVEECNSYVWNNKTYTQSGTYKDTLSTTQGCDSVVTMNLTINYSDQVNLTDSVCAGTRYQENGFDTLIAQAGTYVLTNQGSNVHNCDSTTTLTLTVTPVYDYTLTPMICHGATYMFNGQPLTEAGTYVANLHTAAGCDSVVTLILTVGSEYRDTITAHVCAGGSYHLNGFDVDNATLSGFYANTDTSASGCDSITVLHLIVHDLNTTNLNGSICQGESYTLNGFNVTPANVGDTTVTRIVKTQYNCDSTVVLHLTVNPVYDFHFDGEVCQGNRYVEHGFDTLVTQVGNHTLIRTYVLPTTCDSTVTVNLTVKPSYSTSRTMTLCANSDQIPYTFGDTTLSTSGVYVHNFHTTEGCDSIETLTFTVKPVYDTTIYMTVCDSVSWYNTTYRTSGVYPVTLTAANDCDSIVRLNLTVNYSKDTTINVVECDSYVWNDSTYKTTGIYTKTFAAANGCDSVVRLNLTINPEYDLHYTDAVCQGSNYTNYGFDTTFTTAGTYTLTKELRTVANCDSTVTVVLTVNPAYSTDTTVSVCDVDLPYIWNNEARFTYHTGGDKTITYPLATGCDSIIHLHLIVHTSFEKDTTIQICEGALPYAFDDNHIYPSAGNYRAELMSSFGCDSIYNIQLVVTPSITHTVTRNICDSDLPFSYGDSTFNKAGQYAVVATRADGCNEVTYLTLNVYPTYAHDTTLTICESQLPYNVGDSTFNAAGTKTVHFHTAHTCDSAVTVTLVVNPEYDFHFAGEVCQGERYTEHGFDTLVAQAGNHTLTHTYVLPTTCDSTVTVNLTVNPVYSTSRSVILCANSEQLPYSFGDTLLTTSGVYTYNFHTAAGCDSIETLTFTVKPIYDTTITASICQGDSYVENGFNITSDSVGTRTYTRNLTSSLDCDSTVNLVLTVNPNYYIPENVTVHSTTLPYLWHGHEFMESITAYDSLTTGAGCDSVYFLTLTVTEFNIVQDNPIVLCQGNSQTWRGMELSASGSYADTVETTNTIYMVDVMVNPSYHLYDTLEVCENEVVLPYIWHGIRFTGDSTIEKNYQTSAYCDSIYTLTFIVHPTYNIHVDTAVCENGIPFIWHGKTVSEPGIYTDSLTTAFGCDSIYSLTVNVTYVTSQEDSMTVCGENATYAWHNMTLSETGIYRDTLRNAIGCDSIVYTMNFTKGIPFFHVDSVILSGIQVYEWRGRQITEAGIYFDSLQTVVGCDSVYSLVASEHQYQYIQSNPISLCPGDSAIWLDKVIYEGGNYQDTVENGGVHYVYSVVVTMNQAYYFADTVTKCQSELPFNWHGVNRTQAGVYYDSKQTVNGCDSIYTLTLFVDSSYAFTETVTICANEAPYSWHGWNFYESGVFYDSLQTINGCDSIYMLTLTVNPAVRQNDTAQICQGETYPWRGRSLQTSGFYTDSVANTYGCEDIYTLFLTVIPKSYDTVRATICMGDTYTENGFNVTPTYAGTIYDQLVLTNQNGCDSIVSLVLTVNNSYLFETQASTCDGTPYEWRGGEYTVEGTYYNNYVTAAGCDSVYVLYLTVNPTYEVYVTDTIHLHETYDNHGITVSPSDTGVYTYTIYGFTQSGCDSTVYLTLVVQGNIGVNDYVAPELRIYPNPTTTYVNIEGERMQTVYVYDMHGRLLLVQDVETPEYTQLSFNNLASGNYIIRIRLQDGVMISRKIIKKQF